MFVIAIASDSKGRCIEEQVLGQDVLRKSEKIPPMRKRARNYLATPS
jgi:hypothetical protein